MHKLFLVIDMLIFRGNIGSWFNVEYEYHESTLVDKYDIIFHIRLNKDKERDKGL